MTTRSPTVERVLLNEGRPQTAAHLIALTARNLMEVSTHKSAARFQPPVDGRPAGEAFRDLFDDLRMFGSANIYERMALRPGEVYRPGSGRQVVMADRLRDVGQLLKLTQCQLVGRQRGWALLDAYIEREGWLHDRSGANRTRLNRLRSTPKARRLAPDDRRVEPDDLLAPYRFLWSKAFVRTSLAAALPSDILDRDPTAQISMMRSLRERVEELWAPHADDLFPFELFALAMDFSLHEPKDILATIRKIRPDLLEAAGPRAARLAQPLHELLPHLGDLFDARTGYVRARFSIQNGQPMLATRMVRTS